MLRRLYLLVSVCIYVVFVYPVLSLAAQPQPRSYSSHAYYVLQLPASATHSDAQLISAQLDAELVEQVGELAGHFLLRAPRPDLSETRPDPARRHLLSSLQQYPHQGQQLAHRSLLDDLPEEQISERDIVMERYHAMFEDIQGRKGKRSLHLRDAMPVLSLERQITRKRAKRLMELPELEESHTNVAVNAISNRNYKRSPAPPIQHGTGNVKKPSSFLTAIARRFSIVDPLFFDQWHLVNDEIRKNSINVTGVWSQGITGKGVNVAIVDDGLDMHSEDLADNFHAEGSWDYNDHTALPEPRLSDDLHGTRCAGEISAVKNDVCGVGVAHGAGVAGIRILSAAISDADEASALNYAYQTNHIYSCSWGPPDNGQSMEAPSPLIQKAILNGIQNGRDGKGSVFVFASGNGGAVDDQCNFDGYTNSIYSITISAIDRKGLHPYYSEACSANMAVTYSSGSGDNIHTTDVGEKKCTDRHGGTSAAAPIAAGMVALVLETRPDLTWRDIQHLCVKTALTINEADPDWQRTAAGYLYNHKYGYGNLDAYRLVEAAKTHQLVKPQSWYESQVQIVDKEITSDGISSMVNIDSSALSNANFESLEHITITVNIDHERRGNVEVILDSPNGIRSVLAKPRSLDDATTGFSNWTFMTVKHWHESPVGQWKLTVLDRQDNNKTGTFIDWKMMLWGESVDSSLAKPYKLPDDEDLELPPSPSDSSTSSDVPSSTSSSQDKTKEISKPTAHLPEDHGDAPGESHEPVEDIESPEASITNNPASDLGGNMSRLAKNQTWLVIAAGAVIIFGGGLVAFFVMRRQKRKRQERLARRGYFFESVPGDDDEDTPMTALGNSIDEEAGGRSARMNTSRKSRLGRTRELYDAFGGSDSETDEDSERAALVQGEELDDQYMSEFLADEGPSGNVLGSSSVSEVVTKKQPSEDSSKIVHSGDDDIVFDADQHSH